MRKYIESLFRLDFSRFLVSGAFNTAVTYFIYLALLEFFSYKVSYSVAYASGVVLAYVLNRRYVFRTHRGVLSAFMMPMVYAIQYGIGMAVIYFWVDVFLLSSKVAPLVAIILTIPVTYLLSRLAFSSRGTARGDGN